MLYFYQEVKAQSAHLLFLLSMFIFKFLTRCLFESYQFLKIFSLFLLWAKLIKSRYEYLVSQELPTRIEMESCIQQWTQQLSPMLESEETDLAERRSLNEEIIYWKNRSQDLENIFEQVPYLISKLTG